MFHQLASSDETFSPPLSLCLSVFHQSRPASVGQNRQSHAGLDMGMSLLPISSSRFLPAPRLELRPGSLFGDVSSAESCSPRGVCWCKYLRRYYGGLSAR